jgi:hypothetical protein
MIKPSVKPFTQYLKHDICCSRFDARFLHFNHRCRPPRRQCWGWTSNNMIVILFGIVTTWTLLAIWGTTMQVIVSGQYLVQFLREVDALGIV